MQRKDWMTTVWLYGATIDFAIASWVLVVHMLGGRYVSALVGDDAAKQYMAMTLSRPLHYLHTACLIANGALDVYVYRRNARRALRTLGIYTFCLWVATTTATTTTTMVNTCSGIAQCLAVWILLFLQMVQCAIHTNDLCITKTQWWTLYAYCTYAQSATALYTICFNNAAQAVSPINLLGFLLVFDSLDECRSRDLGTRILPSLPPLFYKWERDPQCVSHRLMSIFDISTLWLTVAYSKSLGVFVAVLLNDLLLKRIPHFARYKRPHRYFYTLSGSFPSTHMVAITCAVLKNNNYTLFSCPQSAFLAIVGMGAYRVLSRAHTLDDVLAGIVISPFYTLVL